MEYSKYKQPNRHHRRNHYICIELLLHLTRSTFTSMFVHVPPPFRSID